MMNSFISAINRMSESVMTGRAEEDIDTLDREVLRSALKTIIENLLPNAPEAAVEANATRTFAEARSALYRILAFADECADLEENLLSPEAQQLAGDWESTLALVSAIRRYLAKAPYLGWGSRGPLQKALAVAPFGEPLGPLLHEALDALQHWEKAEELRADAFGKARDQGSSLAQEVFRKFGSPYCGHP